MTAAPRVPPVVPGTRPELAEIERVIAAERGRISSLYAVLLNSAPVAEGWERLLTAVRNRNSLPPDLRELIILRVAVLNRAPYEFDAHVPHAVAAGVSEVKLTAIRGTIEAGDGLFSQIERDVLLLTDTMTQNVQVPDAVFLPLRATFGPQALVDLVATIAAYNMVSRFLEALRIGH